VDVEDPLGDDRTAHQRADVGADEGDHGDQRVAQQVADDDPVPGQALGDRRADVVGPLVLRDGGAGQPGDVGEGHGGEDQAGHDQLVVTSVAHGRTDPLPLDAEQQLEQQTGDEGRYGDHHQGGQQHPGVDGPAAPHAREHAQCHADDDLEEDGDDREPDGDGERRAHQLGDRLAVERRAEVSGEDVPHVRQVLLPERLVQAELALELGGRRRIAGPLAAQPGDGVAHHVDHEEDQQGGPDEHGDHLEQPPRDIAPHGDQPTLISL
jgi:hypothetical protein